MKRLLTILFCVVIAVSSSCRKSQDNNIVYPWDEPEKPDQPEKPDEPKDTSKAKDRFVWIDASANFQYFANDRARIASDLKKVAEAGFTDVIVDVRPTDGVVLFKSSVAPEAKKLGAWVGSKYTWVKRTAEWDYLQAFIEEGHALGLKVNAALDTFVGGYKYYYGLGEVGPVFDGSIPRSWVSVVNTADGLKDELTLGKEGVVFLNPCKPEVQEYLLKIIAEVAAYDVDGIILDRCRFSDYSLQSDFSDEARSQFEAYLGKTLAKWPNDVFAPGLTSLPAWLSATQKSWLAFRAKVIHDFVEKASEEVHSVNPKVRFGCYVGAWYSTYYESGVNWASPKFDTNASYSKWANKDYRNYGYADHCDFMMLGCYAGTDSIYGSREWTMEGFCKQGRKLLCGDTIFAGGPDVGNGSGFENGGQGSAVTKSVDACINAADGYFCFDLCHIRMYNYWSAFKKGFDKYLQSLN